MSKLLLAIICLMVGAALGMLYMALLVAGADSRRDE